MAEIERADRSNGLPAWLRKAILMDREERKRKKDPKYNEERERLKSQIREMLRNSGINLK